MEEADETSGITQLLQQWGAGNAEALREVIPLVYNQLRAIARNQLQRERAAHTLGATALVNELYLRLAGQYGGAWKDRQHFFAVATMMMRRILIDYAKRVRAGKRGGGEERVPLSDEVPWLGNSIEDILSLDGALDSLERVDPRKARVFELRVLLGCTAEEAAGILEISKATADREWILARAWVHREIRRPPGSEARP